MVHAAKTRGIFPFQETIIYRILLPISLTSCVCAEPPMKVTTKYQNGIMVISVNIMNTTDLADIKLDCVVHLNTNKVFFCLRNGKELPELLDQQFKNRVQHRYDSSTGQLKIELSRFGAEDVGNATCIYFNIGQKVDYSEKFSLNFPEPTSGPATTEGTISPIWVWITHAVIGFGVGVLVGVGVVLVKKYGCQQRGQSQNGDALQLQNKNPDEVVSPSQMENGGYTV